MADAEQNKLSSLLSPLSSLLSRLRLPPLLPVSPGHVCPELKRQGSRYGTHS